MTYAIELFFDESADAAVRRLWRRLAECGLSSLQTQSHARHRPHVSLTVARTDRLLSPGVRTDLEAATGSRRPVRINFQALATFAGDGGVLFLATAPVLELLELHNAVGDVLRDHRIDQWPHYLPGTWVPHCTLAMGLTPRQRATAVEQLSDFQPFQAQVLEIGITDTTTGTTTPLH